MKCIDLHIHSTFSDGADSPELLLTKACALGLTAISVTDHDSTGAYDSEFLRKAEASPLKLITGVELSSRDEGNERHVLGYCFDPVKLDIASRSGKDRERRNLAVLEKLKQLGISVTMEELREKKPVGSIGRPHIAAVLVDRGLYRDTFEAFDALLAEGRPCYVPREVFTIESAAEAIIEAGGKPVLAHPLQYGLSDSELDSLFRRCADCGYFGAEVYYSGYTREETEKLIRLAGKYSLAQTGGSDYHGPSRPERRLGGASVPDSLLEALL